MCPGMSGCRRPWSPPVTPVAGIPDCCRDPAFIGAPRFELGTSSPFSLVASLDDRGGKWLECRGRRSAPATNLSCVQSRNPCDLSVDHDETPFGFGRELRAGLDGRMERTAALDHFPFAAEAQAVRELRCDTGPFSLPNSAAAQRWAGDSFGRAATGASRRPGTVPRSGHSNGWVVVLERSKRPVGIRPWGA